MALIMENVVGDYIIGDKKISVIEYGNDTLVELEVEDELEKCISLDKAKWKFFCDNIENMKVAVKQYLIRGREGIYRLHLGKDIFVSVENGVMCVDIRKWFLPKNDVCLKPSRRGEALKICEFEELFGTLSNINEDIPYFEGVIPCQYTHSESGVVEKCDHCLPSASFKE